MSDSSCSPPPVWAGSTRGDAPTEAAAPEQQDPSPGERPDWGVSLRHLLTLLVAGVIIVVGIWGLENSLRSADANSAISTSGVPGSLEAEPKIGHHAPDFALRNLDGDLVRLSSLAGKRVILNFWASWCPPCRAEMPDLEALYRENQEKGVMVLAVNLREDPEAVARFARSLRLTLPILLDPDSEAANQYQPNYLPTTFFIDGSGVIRDMNVGAMNKATMEFKLERSR